MEITPRAASLSGLLPQGSNTHTMPCSLRKPCLGAVTAMSLLERGEVVFQPSQLVNTGTLTVGSSKYKTRSFHESVSQTFALSQNLVRLAHLFSRRRSRTNSSKSVVKTRIAPASQSSEYVCRTMTPSLSINPPVYRQATRGYPFTCRSQLWMDALKPCRRLPAYAENAACAPS
jgi:hypothetical protein